MLVALGHDGPPQQYWREHLLTGEKLTRCPVREAQLADPAVVAEVERHRLEYYPLYKAGHLLVAGGAADQPALYLDYMRELAAAEKVVQRRFDAISTPPDEDG